VAGASPKPKAGPTRSQSKTVTPSGRGPLLSKAELAESRRRTDEKREQAKRQATSNNSGPSRSDQRSRKAEARDFDTGASRGRAASTGQRGGTKMSPPRSSAPPPARPARTSRSTEDAVGKAMTSVVNVRRATSPGRNTKSVAKRSSNRGGR
jgi:hypothetical protein